jgi:hypothetical protein
MRTVRQRVVGVIGALLLLSVPTSVLHQAFAQTGTSATAVIRHQSEERRSYVAFSRTIRAEFRRSGPFLRASANRYLRDLLLDLRDHWRVERRTGVVSPFDFPDL